MSQRIVLVSSCIRGRLWSKERNADLRHLREALVRMRRDKAYDGAIVVAPYLLYGEVVRTEEELGALRARGLQGAYAHTEVLVTGEALCNGTRGEVAHALSQGLSVQVCPDSSLYRQVACMRLVYKFKQITGLAA